MICLILLMMLSCQSTNYYEIAGMKNELFTKREGTRINDYVNSRAIDRAIDFNYKEQQEEQEEEVKNMEQPETITMITSIIAGIYAVVQTIIQLIKKIKTKK